MEPPSPLSGAPLGEPALRGPDRLQGVPGEFAVAIDPATGAGVTVPPATPADLAAFYPDGYAPYELPQGRLARVASAAIRAWQRRRMLAGFPLGALAEAPAGRALDVGCGRGDLAAALVRRGWRATGVEPSEAACALARTRGVDARPGTLDSVELEPAAYDAAVFVHSLEHVGDPVDALRTVAAALRPGGLLAITVPNFGSWQAQRFGSRWYHLDLPRHRVHFTERALREALERAGFELERIATSTSSVGLAGSLQYLAFGRWVFRGPLSLRVAVALGAALTPLAWLLDRLAGGGDLLHALAQRS